MALADQFAAYSRGAPLTEQDPTPGDTTDRVLHNAAQSLRSAAMLTRVTDPGPPEPAVAQTIPVPETYMPGGRSGLARLASAAAFALDPSRRGRILGEKAARDKDINETMRFNALAEREAERQTQESMREYRKSQMQTLRDFLQLTWKTDTEGLPAKSPIIDSLDAGAFSADQLRRSPYMVTSLQKEYKRLTGVDVSPEMIIEMAQSARESRDADIAAKTTLAGQRTAQTERIEALTPAQVGLTYERINLLKAQGDLTATRNAALLATKDLWETDAASRIADRLAGNDNVLRKQYFEMLQETTAVENAVQSQLFLAQRRGMVDNEQYDALTQTYIEGMFASIVNNLSSENVDKLAADSAGLDEMAVREMEISQQGITAQIADILREQSPADADAFLKADVASQRLRIMDNFLSAIKPTPNVKGAGGGGGLTPKPMTPTQLRQSLDRIRLLEEDIGFWQKRIDKPKRGFLGMGKASVRDPKSPAGNPKYTPIANALATQATRKSQRMLLMADIGEKRLRELGADAMADELRAYLDRQQSAQLYPKSADANTQGIINSEFQSFMGDGQKVLNSSGGKQ